MQDAHGKFQIFLLYTTEILISDVEIICRLMFSFASAPNILLATPG